MEFIMKHKLTLFLILMPFMLIAADKGANESKKPMDCKLGMVDMKACIEKSKLGKREKTSFEALKKQMSENLEKTDKELADLAKKLEDQEFRDSLSPTAEEELKQKVQTLSQEFVRYQNQYYQLLNQANTKILQQLHYAISQASDKVREAKKLDLVFNQEAIFAYHPSTDITDEVIVELDAKFDKENTETKSGKEKS